jgi:hypothetical protein
VVNLLGDIILVSDSIVHIIALLMKLCRALVAPSIPGLCCTRIPSASWKSGCRTGR